MWSKRETVQFIVKLGLHKGLVLIRGMRRSLTDAEQDRVADAIVEHLELSNWKIEEGPPLPGHGTNLQRRNANDERQTQLHRPECNRRHPTAR
jgi:hypothetical protein